jgi:hypothetical protein
VREGHVGDGVDDDARRVGDDDAQSRGRGEVDGVGAHAMPRDGAEGRSRAHDPLIEGVIARHRRLEALERGNEFILGQRAGTLVVHHVKPGLDQLVPAGDVAHEHACEHQYSRHVSEFAPRTLSP